MLTVTRAFAKRNEGQISQVTFTVEGATKFTLDGKELSDRSVEHLLNFALQTLQDSYAGAKNLAEAKEMFAAKYEKLIDGTIGVRQTGESVADEVRIARKIMKQMIKAQSPEMYKKLLQLSEEEQIAALDRNIAKNAEKISKLVSEEMKRLEAEKKAKALLGKELSFEL